MDLDLDNLTAIRVLGRGAMGTVFLVSDRSSSPPFALKVVDKNCPRTKPDSDRRARWELAVLSRLSHPFLPSLLGSLETPSLLAYAFPYCPGGDLNSLRHSLSDSVFSSSAIKFYLSEILAAISHLHSLNIVYRDLKPENILIKSDGHVVLSDFDLSRYLQPKVDRAAGAAFSPDSTTTLPNSPSPPPPAAAVHRRNLTRMFFGTDNFAHHLKKAKSARVSPVGRRRSSASSAGFFHKSHSFVGTEEYVAPEIVRGDGHDFTVDFWALGVLAYEMAYGRTPFKGKSRKETFRNVLTKQPEFVGGRRTELTDLVARLLAKDPAKRLGCGGGTEEIRRHAFFRGVRWEMLAEVGRPPFFATAEELEEAVGSPGGNGRGTEAAAGFDIREYFDKVRSPAPETSVAEY
ncbi:serine/threonine-protein kinase UCN-like [Iris pallida]|uniref:non-specific serine/threonine protein kinase n=1 Tax=Iris pallida TaxID=29817 RepID=A0AAX6GB62_IRIPA|nr:serine/threonine-protein kinase UCN-like [Iris pallida]KAJ6825919.1 serine/threonine-protein kinase UCN-like [Iris pallida]